MKKDVHMYYVTIYDDGPWTLEGFNKVVKDRFKQEQETFKKSKNPVIPTKFTIENVSEWDYDGNRKELRINLYRLETDDEEKRRLKSEKDLEELKKKQEQEKKEKEELKRKKEKELESNPEYIQYKKLQSKLKKQKLI